MTTRRKIVARIPPNVLYDANGLTVATWHNVSIVVWSAQGTLARCEKLEELSAVLAQMFPGGISSVHIVLPDLPLPEAAARAKLGDITKRYSANLACLGTVLEGSGFVVSALQSFIVSLISLQTAGRSFKSRTCTTIAEIAKWLPVPHANRTNVLLDSVALEAALASVRARAAEPNRVARP